MDAVSCIPSTLFGTEIYSPRYRSVGCWQFTVKTFYVSGPRLKDAAIGSYGPPRGQLASVEQTILLQRLPF